MFLATLFALLALGDSGRQVEPDFLTRVERTELLVNGKPSPRVEKDAGGAIVLLRLDGMRLSHDDYSRIATISTLRGLSLRGTNVADEDLHSLHKLTQLTGLVLTNTDVSNAAVDELLLISGLRSICLGNVRITPEAIRYFKLQRPKLSLGYSQRQP